MPATLDYDYFLIDIMNQLSNITYDIKQAGEKENLEKVKELQENFISLKERVERKETPKKYELFKKLFTEGIGKYLEGYNYLMEQNENEMKKSIETADRLILESIDSLGK